MVIGLETKQTCIKQCPSPLQLSRAEAQSVLGFMPHYFQYMQDAHRFNKPTLMAKIVGVYRIGFQNTLNKQALKQVREMRGRGVATRANVLLRRTSW